VVYYTYSSKYVTKKRENNMNKEWKDIDGYEGLYQINTNGQVMTFNCNHTKKTTIMKPHLVGHGYMQIGLRNGKGQKSFLVHRLVAKAFIPNPNNYPQVNHKNENITDNTVGNLEWCTSKYNYNYGTRKLRWMEKMSNSIIGTNVLSGEKIYFETPTKAIEQGFNCSFICRCCKKRKNFQTHKGYTWEYGPKILLN
jgi:hypothetical protein